jgi:hypothetical protein
MAAYRARATLLFLLNQPAAGERRLDHVTCSGGVNPPEGKGGMLASQPGQLVAEVEGLELTPDKANFETLRYISEWI